MKIRKLIGAMLGTSVLLAISCAGPTPQATTPVPATSPAGEAPIAAPVPTTPPIILGGPGLLPPPGKENVYSVQMDLIPSKLVYMPGEQVQLEVVLTNASKGKVEPIIVSSLPPIISLVPAGVFVGPALPPNVDRRVIGKPVKVFPAGNEERKLVVGEKVTYDLVWDQKDGDGKQVAPGWYYYESRYNFHQESADKDVGSGLRSRAFLVQYPQGARTKTIETNQSRTLSGVPLAVGNETKMVDVVITLKRVEMNEKGVTFYVLMTSPDNPVSGYNNEVWMRHHVSSAQYAIDGLVKDARAPNTKFTESGVQLTLGAFEGDPNYLDPVPTDAKELTFVIPEIQPDWKGPWEFKIPLQ